MASADTSLKAKLKTHVSKTNTSIQKLLSSRSIPIWINPNNSNYYLSNPYMAGDIVILLSDVDDIYYLLRNYYENIAENIGVDSSYFQEKNNPELTNEVLNTLIYGGYLKEDQYMNPMTMVSNSEKGYGLFVSLKNYNYDVPGASDSWFNLDMSESLDTMQLQVSRIISILTSEDYIDKVKGGPMDGGKEYIIQKEDSNYLENRLDYHKLKYHFGDESYNPDLAGNIEEVYEKLNKLQTEIEAHTNTTTSIMRNPFMLNGEIVGYMYTIIQTTGQMFFYCILDTTKLEKDKDITIQFTPNNISDILVPIVLQTNEGIIEVDNPKYDDYVLTANGECAWFAESYVRISNEVNASNNIIIQTSYGFDDANFNNNFNGFLDETYIATYTPIGNEIRTDNIAIHCSPVREISRTTKSMTFQLNSEYVWKYSGIAIALSGKYEVNG